MSFRNVTMALALPTLLLMAIIVRQEPVAHRVDHVDVYHGEAVLDPYRWLEDMDAEETMAWVTFQDKSSRKFTESVPGREIIRQRLEAILEGKRYASPLVRDDRSFFTESGGELVAARVLMQDGDGQPTVVIDPMELDGSGDLRVSRFVPSENGRLLAYALVENGSRWETWRIRDIEANRDLPDRLIGINGGRSVTPHWRRDGRGIYYERFTPPAPGDELTHQLVDERLMFHRLGTSQDEDEVVLDPASDDIGIISSMAQDGRYLVLQVGIAGDPNNRVLYVDLENGSPMPLIEDADAAYYFVGSDASAFWFMTNHDAPNWKVISVSIERPQRHHWRDLVGERTDAMDPTIGAVALGDKIVVGYRRDARLMAHAFHSDGAPAFEIDLAGGGETWAFTGRQGDRFAYYRLQSAVDPGTIYRLDLHTGESSIHTRPDLPYDPHDVITRQVFYDSYDGTRIPMFLVHHKDIALDGGNPVFMYGYGAFNWAAAPWFQPKVAAWLGMGGVYALPNIRGGGEYGKTWHEAGIGRRKQNSIDDYLAAAEWLVAEGYTSSGRLVANGGSASGPLVGAAIVQRPQLFAASIIDYPALDMLRLEAFSGGRGWRSDFGSIEDREDFKVLRAYSPYHNVAADRCYPATMISPGDRDEVTVPMHSYKFAAALQHAQSCDRPIMLRVSWGAGHGAGATPADRIATWTDQLAFLAGVLDLEPVALGTT